MKHILIILAKEWDELRRERSMVAAMIAFPLLITALSIGVTFALGAVPDDDTADLGAVVADPALQGLPMDQLGQVVIGRQFALLFLMMPLFIPSIIAAYSIVGEKTGRTLEPLLATPISTWELLVAKSLAALIPAMALTWACGLIFTAGVALVSLSPAVAGLIISPAWVLLLLLCSPLLALIAVAFTVLISARVNDPRTAQQLSGIAVVPVMALFFSQLIGIVVVNVVFVLGLALALALLAVCVVWLAVRLFAREAILTRWT